MSAVTDHVACVLAAAFEFTTSLQSLAAYLISRSKHSPVPWKGRRRISERRARHVEPGAGRHWDDRQQMTITLRISNGRNCDIYAHLRIILRSDHHHYTTGLAIDTMLARILCCIQDGYWY
ncbi:uncharacterized protein EV420DRAFT_147616 [Desarmillaria tabescens]|uniref:Uncharacterized protein n=1 Tax=Armillaria tabescens TaxID=1929756 RepID=A0AA39TS96_ARMTA|nr:uncharacterized protein EV420DRAFT_147616 [Desarmillaria tabescens]KAK0462089.1 hypothetical protein EV420DRAFT_147616 [Desarmillaria tabescens]